MDFIRWGLQVGVYGPIHMGSQVPSPTHVSKPQLLILTKPLQCGLYSLRVDLDYFMQRILGTYVES